MAGKIQQGKKIKLGIFYYTLYCYIRSNLGGSERGPDTETA